MLVWWRNDETDSYDHSFAYSLGQRLAASTASRPNRVKNLKKSFARRSLLTANKISSTSMLTHAHISKQVPIICI